MSHRCQPGDLAVVVKSFGNVNTGKVVRCIRPVVDHQLPPIAQGWPCMTLDGLWWELDTDMVLRSASTFEAVLAPYNRDDCLRPLRDTNGKDETLAWASLPSLQSLQSLVPLR